MSFFRVRDRRGLLMGEKEARRDLAAVFLCPIPESPQRDPERWQPSIAQPGIRGEKSPCYMQPCIS